MTGRFLILILLMSMQVHAAPLGKDLLHACRDTMNKGFPGIEGAMCEYYVTPCDCELGEDPVQPRFCPPQRITTARLAATVVKGLLNSPDLRQTPARAAAATILARKYPCTE